MEFLEKDLEQIIWESDKEKLSVRGLEITGVLKRQLRIGNFGIADLVEFNRDYIDGEYSTIPYLDITVYELKKDQIGISAFLQAVGYCKGIKTYLNVHKPTMKFKFNIVLIGKTIDTSGSFIYLEDLIYDAGTYPTRNIKGISYYNYKYGVEGLEFESAGGYNLTEYGFKPSPKCRF